MKLSEAQFGALSTLDQHGPCSGREVLMPKAMDGTRKVKLECHLMNATTLAKLEGAGLVEVRRDTPSRTPNAVGALGHPRRVVTISITDAGRAALATA